MWIELVNTICNLIITIISICALISGIVYINKRLKIYIYEENNRICVVGLDKGHGNCFILKAFLKMPNKNIDLSIGKDAILSFDKSLLENQKNITFIIIDNFGRKYKKKYRSELK